MRYRIVVATGLLLASMHARTVLGGADQALPVRDGRPAVAVVNGESIALDEFLMEIDPSADRTQLLRGYGTPKHFELLDRLVNVKLVVQEAATIGVAEQAEIRKQVEVSSRAILRDVFLERVVGDVKPDPAAVEAAYKELVAEWKTSSLLFDDEGAARRARDEIAGGASFAEVSARAMADKTARTESDDEYHARKDYLPQIAAAVAALQVGQVSPIIPIQAGFVIVTVTDVRYPENEEARTEARKQAVSRQQLAALKAHEESSMHEYVTVNEDVVDRLDYEAEKPGVDALLADKRIIAEIKGAAPVTVGDLTEYLRLQSFHGPDKAGQRRRMNETKQAALDATLRRRLLNMEALRLGLDKSAEYIDRVNAYEDSLVFDSFVQRVIVPDSKVTEEEVKQHYADHLKEYSSPEMVRIRSVAFTGRGPAEQAMRKLAEGADYGWLVANAGDQVGKGTEGLLELDGRPLTTDSMPEGVKKALEGAKAGEFRLYASPEGHAYVLAIQAVIAPTARPYAEVRDEIAKKMYVRKIQQHLDDYIGKLRAASEIEIHLKKVQ